MPSPRPPTIALADVVRLWFHQQGLGQPRGQVRCTRRAFVTHLERSGGLQLDSVNVLDRAHYLTLWSRFANYDRTAVDRWIYRDRVAFEYWAHEASVLPLSHLPFSRRRMARFPDSWSRKSWWSRFNTSLASKRRVLRRLRNEGPLESAAFARQAGEHEPPDVAWAGATFPKEDGRSLKLLWHAGRTAVATRRHFRRVYDLAERVYPTGPTATTAAYEDHWLLSGLTANGVASEQHLVNYLTAPEPAAADRKRIIARNVKKGHVVEVRVQSLRSTFYARPEHLDTLDALDPPHGTTLLSPFDSLLWQRARARDLLDFDYRVEIYVPSPKRIFGYYVLPIVHDGRLVGRLDPKFHRDRGVLEIQRLVLESEFRAGRAFRKSLQEALEDLADFQGATDLRLPPDWK